MSMPWILSEGLVMWYRKPTKMDNTVTVTLEILYTLRLKIEEIWSSCWQPKHILFGITVRWESSLGRFRYWVFLIIWNLGAGAVGRGREVWKEPHRSSGVPSLALLLRGPSGDVVSLSEGSETSRESFLQKQRYFHLYINVMTQQWTY